MKIKSKWIFTFLFLSIVVCFGFGNSIAYKLSIGVIFALPLVDSIRQKQITKSIVAAGLILSSCYCNSLFLSSSLIFLFLILFYEEPFAFSFIASRILFSISQYLFLNDGIVTWYSAYIIFILFLFISSKYPIFGKLIAITYALLIVLNSFSFFNLPIVQENNVVPGYGLGNTIRKIVKKDQNGNAKMLINLKHYEEIEDDTTYYLEHDAPTQFTDGNYYQKRPWGNNIILANETIQMAISRDGFLISNLGGKIRQGKHKIFMSFIEGFRSIPFAILDTGKIIMSDSDFIADGLAPYQANLIKRITKTDYSYMCFHIFSALCILGVIFVKHELFIVLPILFYVFIYLWPIDGDVRFVGHRRYWPHTTLGEGVAKSMQDQGINAIFGSKNTSVLVVSTGNSAKWKNEKLIILEPMSKVKIGDKVYKSGSLELGFNNSIIDARDISVNGESLGPLVNTNGIKIIATGSPSRVDFRDLQQ